MGAELDAGGFGDGLLGLALGADEQDAAALGDGVAHDLQSLVQHRDGLGQVDDVDAVPLAVDELAHAGVPTLRLVTVVNASFEQLTQREIGKRHVHSFSGLRLSGGSGISPNRWTCGDVSPEGPPPPVKCAPYSGETPGWQAPRQQSRYPLRAPRRHSTKDG